MQDLLVTEGASPSTNEQLVELRESCHTHHENHLKVIKCSPIQDSFSGFVSIGTEVAADESMHCNNAQSVGLAFISACLGW